MRRSEGMYQVNDYTYADAGVGDVECRVVVTAEVEVEEVDYVPVEHAIHQVANDSATEQAEGELDGALFEFKGVPPKLNPC